MSSTGDEAGGAAAGVDGKVDYYKLLGVERNASADEIRRAYRQLARKWHTDRGGNKEMMQQLNQAKSVLLDPARRRMYDLLGEQGESYMDTGDVGPEVLLRSKLAGPILCLACLVLVLALAFAVLLVLRVSELAESLPWMLVFGPLVAVLTCVCLLDACVFVIAAGAGSGNDEAAEDLRGLSLPSPVHRVLTTLIHAFKFLASAMLVLAAVLLPLRLDDPSFASWATTFTPLYVYAGIKVLQKLLSARRAFFQKYHYHPMDRDDATCSPAFAIFLLHRPVWFLATLASLVLLAVRLDGDLSLTAWTVASPLFAAAAVDVANACFLCTQVADPSQARGAGDATYSDAEARAPGYQGSVLSETITTLSVLIFAGMLALICMRANDPTSISTALFWTLLVLLCCCGSCCVGGASRAGSMDFSAASGSAGGSGAYGSGQPPPGV